MPAVLSSFRLRTPGDLIAAVPVFLGFHPRASLVLIATGCAVGGRIGLTVRVDLPPPEHARVVAAQIVEALRADDPPGAVVLVVAPPHPLGVLPARGAVDLVTERLRTCGIAVDTVLWASGTRGGDPWRCYEPCGCSGRVADPAASVAMAGAVAEGRVVAGSREDLARRVAPADPAVLARRQALLGSASQPEEPLAVIDLAVADAVAGRLVLDDDRVVALALALGRPEVRDETVRRHCLLPDRPVVDELWAALAREMPDPEAAHPAALLALAALLRGDGAMAWVALDRAAGAWPGHPLADVMWSAAAGCVRPSFLRSLMISAYDRSASSAQELL